MLKDMRIKIYSYLAGSPVKLSVSSTKDGLPKALRSFNNLIRNRNPNGIRGVLTILLVSRLIPGWKEVCTSTITTPSKISEEIVTNFSQSLPRIFNNKGIAPLSDVEWEDFHLNLSKGPNGMSLISAIKE